MSLHRARVDCGYFAYVYCQGINQNLVFRDQEDFGVFLGLLRDSLSSPAGKYSSRINLLAYRLLPDSFHLVLREKSPRSLKAFTNSLRRRYSAYYYSKYPSTDPLFSPSYFLRLKDLSVVLYLTHCLHRPVRVPDPLFLPAFSSLEEYLGRRQTPWIDTKTVLDAFVTSAVNNPRGEAGYGDFVTSFNYGSAEKVMLLDRIFPKNISFDQLPLIPPPPPPPSVPLPAIPQNLAWRSALVRFTSASAVFLILLSMGAVNVINNRQRPPSQPEFTYTPPIYTAGDVAGQSVTAPEATPTPTLFPIPLLEKADIPDLPSSSSPGALTVRIGDTATVNIRAGPSVDTKIIGKANEGDTFEYLSEDSGWYQVKLVDSSTGYISSTFVEVSHPPPEDP